MPDEEKHRLLQLLPLLRLADSLDRSHSQHIDHVECQVRPGSVVHVINAVSGG